MTIFVSSIYLLFLLDSEQPIADTKVAYLPANDELEGLSVDQVVVTLRSLKIPESVLELFREEQVDGQILIDMDETIMREQFGMRQFHVMKLKKFLDGWRPNLKYHKFH